MVTDQTQKDYNAFQESMILRADEVLRKQKGSFHPNVLMTKMQAEK